MTILAKTLGQILVQNKLPERKNLFFKPFDAKPDITVFAQIVNCEMTNILMSQTRYLPLQAKPSKDKLSSMEQTHAIKHTLTQLAQCHSMYFVLRFKISWH